MSIINCSGGKEVKVECKDFEKSDWKSKVKAGKCPEICLTCRNLASNVALTCICLAHKTSYSTSSGETYTGYSHPFCVLAMEKQKCSAKDGGK